MASKIPEELTPSGQDEPEHEPCDDFLSMPRFEFAHQAMCDKITKSVAEITHAHADDKFIVPAIILEIEQGFYCILFECGVMRYLKTPSFELRFLDSSQVVRLSSMALASVRTSVATGNMSLAAFSYNTSPNAYQPILLGQNVSMGQKLYLFDFRFGTPTVTKGTVNYADEFHFLLSAKPHDRYYFGALVFDEDCLLVGIVFGHAGSVQSIQVNYLRKVLLDFFPGIKTLDDFFRKLKPPKDCHILQ